MGWSSWTRNNQNYFISCSPIYLSYDLLSNVIYSFGTPPASNSHVDCYYQYSAISLLTNILGIFHNSSILVLISTNWCNTVLSFQSANGTLSTVLSFIYILCISCLLNQISLFLPSSPNTVFSAIYTDRSHTSSTIVHS